MTKIVWAVALLVVFCAFALLAWTALQLPPSDPKIDQILALPSALDRWAQISKDAPDRSDQVEPLLAQARLLASYLIPSVPPDPPAVRPQPPVAPPTPIRSAAPSRSFQVCATSYFPSQPDKSMALVGELQNQQKAARWVKAGTQLGRLVVQEVRRGSILCREGDRIVEISVEPRTTLTPLVRDHIASLARADSTLPDLLEVESDSMAK